jgi:quinohemoprotein ethanol dehydrogenase
VLYFSGTNGKAYAVDAKTGRLLWEFDAKAGTYRPDIFRYSGSLGGHRGVAYWHGKVYVASVDGRLFALDARTGSVVWSVQTFDKPNAPMTISGAPRIINGKVLIGHNGDPGTRGYLTAYDAETGKMRWRFYTVPGDPQKGFENAAMATAAKTWRGDWWKAGGNGAVWDGITFDPDLNRIYFGTANAILNDNAGASGDNLFTSSVVALDADTGAYVWHYQENPGGGLDYDSNATVVLAELKIDGASRKVLLHAPKNGFFYVIDRATGKLLSVEKFAKATWAERIDLATGRPVGVADMQGLWPSLMGAHNWQPMSFNPATGLVYIPTMKVGMKLTAHDVAYTKLDPDDGTGGLLAWDPVSQTKRWEVRYADSFWNGGTLATAGNLVFQGTGRGQFAAFNAASGAKLWSFDAGLGIVAAPATYEIDGTQYVSVLVGYGGACGALGKLCDYGWRFEEQPRRLVTFALDKQTRLPPANPPRFTIKARDDPHLPIDTAAAARGETLFHAGTNLCFACHGPKLEDGGSFAPDLRESSLALDWPSFVAVLHDGSLASAGMPKFADLSRKDLRDLYLYIRLHARRVLDAPP